MKASIEVEDRKEADLIRRGLEQSDVRAFVKIMGALSALPTDRAKIRTLRFVSDSFAEQDAALLDQIDVARLEENRERCGAA